MIKMTFLIVIQIFSMFFSFQYPELHQRIYVCLNNLNSNFLFVTSFISLLIVRLVMLTVGIRQMKKNDHQHTVRMSSESVANLMQGSTVVEHLLAETRRQEPVAETFLFYRNLNYDL